MEAPGRAPPRSPTAGISQGLFPVKPCSGSEGSIPGEPGRRRGFKVIYAAIISGPGVLQSCLAPASKTGSSAGSVDATVGPGMPRWD